MTTNAKWIFVHLELQRFQYRLRHYLPQTKKAFDHRKDCFGQLL